MSASPRGPRDRLLLLAFVLSGAAALGYELLWTRLLALTLGHETHGVLGALAGFFLGMAIGAALLHRRAAAGPDPVGLFVRLELAAAAYAALSPYLLHALARALPPLLGPWAGDQGGPWATALTLGTATLVLLPGALCLGATLPALVAARRRACPADVDPRGLGRLYAANTLGAVLGVLAAVHLILPALGFALGALFLAALGVLAALLARRWARGLDLSAAAADPPAVDASRDPDPDLLAEPWVLHAMSFGTGLAGVGLEVVGVQILGQRLESTVFTFAHVLAVYLLGAALGAALYQRLAPPALAGRGPLGGRPATLLAALLLLLAAAVVPAALGLAVSPDVLEALAPEPSTLGRAALAELAAAALVLLLPAALMGALFSHVVGLCAGRGVGRAYALNTLGGALAPFLFGAWAIPRLGYADAFYLVAYAYLALFAGFCWLRRFPTATLLGGVLAVVGLTALGPRALNLITLEPGWSIVEQRETLYGVVTVAELAPPPAPPGAAPPPPLRRLQVDQNFRMGGALSFGEQRMGHLPLLLSPRRGRVLFLGVGAGATAGAAADLPDVREVVALELIPEVLDLLHHFHAVNRRLDQDPRFTLRAADARRALAADRTTYDVIIGDLFHPGRDGAAALFAREHFEAVRARLAPGGLYAQWLPLHQLDDASLRTIARTFLAVFPDADAYLGIFNARTPSLALVGYLPPETGDRPPVGLAALRADLARPGLTLVDPRDLLASRLLDARGLAAFAGDGPQNRDLAPRVLFTAPRAAYAGELGRGADALDALLAARAPLPDRLLAGDPAELAELLAAAARYQGALDHYLRGEIARAGRPEDRVDVADLAPYLAAYDADPAFPAARGLLYGAAARDPAVAAVALPRMLARTPDEPRVYQAYLHHLQRVGDRAAFERVLAEAQARFGPPAGPAPARDPAAPADPPSSAP